MSPSLVFGFGTEFFVGFIGVECVLLRVRLDEGVLLCVVCLLLVTQCVLLTLVLCLSHGGLFVFLCVIYVAIV